MYEPDYSGDMRYYQNQLLKKGITKDMLDMDKFSGLTARELQGIVNSARIVKRENHNTRKRGETYEPVKNRMV